MAEQGRIKQMSPELASQIAAGEVVERPFSIVKELMENAIDAGSTFITIETVQGGNQLIRISDNGMGMLRDDIPLAFARHATSKLQNTQDLFDLQWMGFRGEALYSIAAVSHVTLITKRQEDAVGSRVECMGGETGPITDVGCPNGTTLTVENLFYNVPARRKFLRSAHTEAGAVSSVVVRLILSHPGISIKYIHDGKVIYHSSGDHSLVNAIHTVYGKTVSANIRELHDELAGIQIDGCLGLPSIARANRQQEHIFVNGRAIQSTLITKALENGYGTSLMTQRFPFCVLDIHIPGEWVDVNVHPNKLQVRFADDSKVFQAVNGIIASAVQSLATKPITYSINTQTTPPKTVTNIEFSTSFLDQTKPSIKSPYSDTADIQDSKAEHHHTTIHDTIQEYRNQTFQQAESLHRNYRELLDTPVPTIKLRQNKDDMKLSPETASVQETLPIWNTTKFKMLGTAFSTYIILEIDGLLIWIDQHAAHERLLYDQYIHQLEKGMIVSQQLLIPQVIEVSFEEKNAILEHLAELEQIGFIIEEYGRLSFTIRSIPQILGQAQTQELIMQILHCLESTPNRNMAERNMVIAQMACKKAVKAGDTLDDIEIQQLYQLIQKEQVPLTCPHGRPICFIMTQKDIEKQFKRIVS